MTQISENDIKAVLNNIQNRTQTPMNSKQI
jgi:hypothetical protein